VFVTSARETRPEPGFAVPTTVRAGQPPSPRRSPRRPRPSRCRRTWSRRTTSTARCTTRGSASSTIPEGRALIARTVPFGRLGRPEEVGELVAFLVSGPVALHDRSGRPLLGRVALSDHGTGSCSTISVSNSASVGRTSDPSGRLRSLAMRRSSRASGRSGRGCRARPRGRCAASPRARTRSSPRGRPPPAGEAEAQRPFQHVPRLVVRAVDVQVGGTGVRSLADRQGSSDRRDRCGTRRGDDRLGRRCIPCPGHLASSSCPILRWSESGAEISEGRCRVARPAPPILCQWRIGLGPAARGRRPSGWRPAAANRAGLVAYAGLGCGAEASSGRPPRM
jgi:hypothetical protein